MVAMTSSDGAYGFSLTFRSTGTSSCGAPYGTSSASSGRRGSAVTEGAGAEGVVTRSVYGPVPRAGTAFHTVSGDDVVSGALRAIARQSLA